MICLSVSDHFMGLALKELNIFSVKLGWKNGLIFLTFSKSLQSSVHGNHFIEINLQDYKLSD